MKRARDSNGAKLQPAQAHADHLRAHDDHVSWFKDLERWRQDYEDAVKGLAHRLLSDFDLAEFEDALDRHEAAIVTHEELVEQHERRLRRERAGAEPASDEVEALHLQMHERHERSRQEHQELSDRLQRILAALGDL